MHVLHTIDNGILVITPQENSLHAEDVPQFKEQVNALIKKYPQSQVIFDLRQLSLMDSSGIGSLLSFFRLLNKQNRDLKFACVNKPMRNIFELVSINKLFMIFDTLESAINSCDKTGVQLPFTTEDNEINEGK